MKMQHDQFKADFNLHVTSLKNTYSTNKITASTDKNKIRKQTHQFKSYNSFTVGLCSLSMQTLGMSEPVRGTVMDQFILDTISH